MFAWLVCVQDGICRVFWAGKFRRGTPLKFVKNVVRVTAVQIVTIFPAKSLGIFRANF